MILMTRIRFRSASRAVALALALTTALSGCGIGGSFEGKDDGGQVVDQSGAGVFEEGTTMKAIQDRGKLIVGINFGLKPFAYKNEITGSPEGFDVELAKWIASGIFGKNIENRITWVELDPRDRELALEQDRVDFVVGRYDVTAARKRFVDFAGPYYVTHQALITSNLTDRQNRVNSVLQLNGRKICVARGSGNIESVIGVLPAADFSMVQNSIAECGVALINNSVSAILADAVDSMAWLSAAGGDVKVLAANYGLLPYGVGLRLDNDDMREYLNNRITDWGQGWDKARGQYLGGVPGETGKPVVDRY
jgi:glutamate transport system substrate-binding protein